MHRRSASLILRGAIVLGVLGLPLGPSRSEAQSMLDAMDKTPAELAEMQRRVNAPRLGYSPYACRSYPTRVFLGDTHLHTANSGDDFTEGNKLSPEDAYRYARGEEVISSTGLEGANRIELAINLKTARSLGITIPRDILVRADRVIE